MKTDTQHLDYLISQYVDGCLDAGSRKSLEQRLLNDPEARKLYKEQHDVQDVLDDWGNRIPMINWEQFDHNLALRLENETVGGRTRNLFRRWGRAMSVAAGLMIAASLGYGWHAWSVKSVNSPIANTQQVHPQANRGVAVEPLVTPSDVSVARVQVDEQSGNADASANNSVAITPPGNSEGADALSAGVKYGLPNVADAAQAPGVPGASSVHVAQVPANSAQPGNRDKDPIPPAFP